MRGEEETEVDEAAAEPEVLFEAAATATEAAATATEAAEVVTEMVLLLLLLVLFICVASN